MQLKKKLFLILACVVSICCLMAAKSSDNSEIEQVLNDFFETKEMNFASSEDISLNNFFTTYTRETLTTKTFYKLFLFEKQVRLENDPDILNETFDVEINDIKHCRGKMFTSESLKIVALICMLIDHAGATLFPQCDILRSIGRVSFPLYAFLLAQGCKHTHSMERYLLGLGIFALISEIPYDLAFGNSINFLDQTNIFYTLFLSAACVYIYVFFTFVYFVCLPVQWATRK